MVRFLANRLWECKRRTHCIVCYWYRLRNIDQYWVMSWFLKVLQNLYVLQILENLYVLNILENVYRRRIWGQSHPRNPTFSVFGSRVISCQWRGVRVVGRAGAIRKRWPPGRLVALLSCKFLLATATICHIMFECPEIFDILVALNHESVCWF